MSLNIITFGCKTNQSESNNIISSLNNYGNFDIIIVNTCAVTAESERKLRQFINKTKTNNPDIIIVLIGCFPQAFPDKARELQSKHDIQIILGNSQKHKINIYLEKYFRDKKNIFEIENINLIKKFDDINFKNCTNNIIKTRAFVKIQDGCDRFCSYCIIPYARGRIRSRDPESIIREIKLLSENNYQEIVLTGINLLSYGKDFSYKNNYNITKILEQISEIDNIKRIRLGSLEPDLITPDLVYDIKSISKICPQFHISVQSGSNNILKKMRRLYTREEYLDKINLIKDNFENATFTTDLMVGFPGETDQDFEESLDIISEAGFLKTHVFPYSQRSGTLAASFDNQITRNIKSQRVKQAMQISNQNTKKILDKYINTHQDVLFETCDNNNFYKGYTDNYILVKAQSSENISGKIIKTRILSAHDDFLIGEIF